MAAVNDHAALTEAMARLVDAGVTPAITEPLDQRTRAAGESLRQAILADVPAFSATGNPDVLPELARHADEQVAEVRRLLAGGSVGDFAFVRLHAHRRAEQRFPLEATLHAYRCGHKVLSHWIRDATGTGASQQSLAAIADFSIEYTNTISTIAAAEYVAHTRLLAEVEGDRRTELLGILLSGFDESDGRVARLLKRAGYLEQRQSFCVVVGQSVDPLEMESPPRAQRLAEAVTQAASTLGVRTLIGMRGNVVTAVLSETRRLSGWTAPQAKLAGRIHSVLLTLGPAVLLGVSSDQPSTAFIPKALKEASIALDFATVSERVVSFADLPIRRLLLHRAGDYVQSALPAWIAEFSAADAKLQGALVQTLRAYADADLNVLEAARTLKLHPNTLYARMQRINALTGLNCQHFHDLTELLFAVDCRVVGG